MSTLEQEQKGFLTRINPTVKLLICTVFMVLATPVDTLSILLLQLAVPIIGTLLFGGITVYKLLKRLAPFIGFFLVYLWMQAAFSRIPGSHVWAEFLWFSISAEGLQKGLVVATRMMVFVSYGAMFALTTDITYFVRSLMQQARISPKIAYGMLAGIRFVPTFRSEFEQIRLAHRIRGIDRKRGIQGKWEALKRYSIPLLAQAIRKAERVAVAMEARGFDGSHNRTHFKEVTVGRVDFWFAIWMVVVHIAILLAVIWGGIGQ